MNNLTDINDSELIYQNHISTLTLTTMDQIQLRLSNMKTFKITGILKCHL